MTRAVVALLALSMGCSGPCKETEAARRTLLARKDVAVGPHAQLQLPFPLANRLLANVVEHEPEIPFDPASLGPFARYVDDVHARILDVQLVPAAHGVVGFDARVMIVDGGGELMTLSTHADVAPVVEGGHTLAIAVRGDSLSMVKPEFSARIRDRLAELAVERLPSAARSHAKDLAPFIVDKLAGELAKKLYELLRATLLKRIGDLTTIRIEMPQTPMSRVEVDSTQRSLVLGIVSTLPVRTAVHASVDEPNPDEVGVAISGSAAAELANWGIANGMLPPRYTRGLEPAPDGTYVPHFDWRADQPDRPLVVHMFKVEDGCAHFVVGVQPHVEVKDGAIRTWVENKNLEHVDAAFGFAMLARMSSVFESTTSSPKKVPGHVHITIGGRDVSGRLTRAAVVDNELHVGVALDIHGPI